MKEDYAVVLDYLPMGKPTDPKGTPIAQVIGTRYYTLLEVIPKPGADMEIFEKVFVGRGERPKVKTVKGRIHYDELTSLAKSNLDEAVRRIVLEREDEYVRFFNEARPLTIRLHTLELLPGIGKKHLFHILDEREKEPFKSFEDIKQRVPLLGDPVKLIVSRIVKELTEPCKYYLFVRPAGR